MTYSDINISKFLSYVLRHHPEDIGGVDGSGWAAVSTLIYRANQLNIKLDFEILKNIVANDDKQRFAFSEDFKLIRANQGHSIWVELGLQPRIPPEILFHGTSKKAVSSIIKTGIEKRSRQYVHLSQDIETAIKVGQRHGKPVVFEILAREMYNANFKFFLSDNGVWLTDFVPIKYITFLNYI